MKKIILIIFSLLILTACSQKNLPDPDMALPTVPPDADAMTPDLAPTNL